MEKYKIKAKDLLIMKVGYGLAQGWRHELSDVGAYI